MNRERRIAAAAAVALGLAAAVAVATGWGAARWYAAIVLAAAVVLGELAVVHVAFARHRWTFSLTEGVIGAAFYLASGAWAVPAVAAGVVVAQSLRRQAALKTAYNTAQITASTAVGAAVATAAGGGMHGAAIGLVALWLANQMLSALPLALLTGQRLVRLAVEDLPLHAVHSAGTMSVGLLAAWLALHAPFGLLALLAPAALLWLSYDEQTRRAAEARLFRELARGQERAATLSIDVSNQVVLTAAARLFGGADVSMVVLEADGPVSYVGDENGVQRQRTDAGAFDAPWVMRALGARGVLLGSEDGRPFCSAVLGDPDHPLAVLVARRPAGAAPFGRREAALLAVLVRQAESWLSAAEIAASREAALARAAAAGQAARALGELGADVAPALGVLRESASRLARLAAAPAPPDAVDAIVDELHAVEQAVASLLGAIALAADPEIAALGAAVPSTAVVEARGTSEGWTATGVLEGVRARS